MLLKPIRFGLPIFAAIVLIGCASPTPLTPTGTLTATSIHAASTTKSDITVSPISTPTAITKAPEIAPTQPVSEAFLPIEVSLPLPEGAVSMLGMGSLTKPAVSPDGRYLAVSSATALSVYQMQPFIEIWHQLGNYGTPHWSPDGKMLGAGSCGMVVFDAATGQRLYTTEGVSPFFMCFMKWSPDAHYIATLTNYDPFGIGGDDQSSLTVWSAANGKVAFVVDHLNSALDLAWSPDGSQIAASHYTFDRPSGTGTASLDIWNTATGQKIASPITDISVDAVGWSPNGKYLTALDSNGYVRLLDPTSYAVMAQLKAVDPPTSDVRMSWSPDSTRIAFAEYDGLTILGIPEGDIISTTKMSETSHYLSDWDNLNWSPDGTRIGWSRKDVPGVLTDVSTGEVIQSFEGSFSEAVIFSSDGAYVITDNANTITVWDAQSLHPVQRIVGVGQVNTVFFSMDGQTLYAADDSALYQWDVSTGKPEHSTPFSVDYWLPQGSVTTIDISPDQSRLLVGGSWVIPEDRAGMAAVINVADGSWKTLDPHFWGVMATVAWSPDGAYAMACNQAGGVEIWRSQTLTTNSFTYPCSAAAWSPDGHILVAAKQAAHLQFFDTTTWKLVRSLGEDVGDQQATSIIFTSDGNTLAVLDDEGSVTIWDLAKGEIKFSLADLKLNDIAWSPDSRYLAGGTLTSDGGGRVYIWDTVKGQLLPPLNGQRGGVTAVAFSPDGRYLASGSADGTILIWEVP